MLIEREKQSAIIEKRRRRLLGRGEREKQNGERSNGNKSEAAGYWCVNVAKTCTVIYWGMIAQRLALLS